jgi:hypothetical protein
VGRKKKKKKQQQQKKKKVVTIPFFFSVFGSDFVKIEVAEVKEEEEKEKGKGEGVSSLVKVEWVFEKEQEEEEKRIVCVVVMGDHLLSWFVGVCFFLCSEFASFLFLASWVREREREREKGSSRFFSVTDRDSAVGGGACFFNQIGAGEAAGGRGRIRRSLGKKGAQ